MLIPCAFRDKILREITREKTAADMWAKIESTYMTKSLAQKLCMKQKLYSFYMVENKSIMEKLPGFHKIIYNLQNIEVKIEDEDKVLLLLSSLPNLEF